jgi:tetratricopeptide (TPR) repeat protein
MASFSPIRLVRACPMVARRVHQPSSFRIISWSLAFVFLALSAPALQSQVADENAALQGVIRDSQGKAVVGATVSLQAKDGTQALTTHSDSQGNYAFASLRAGTYALRAEKAECGEAAVPSLVLGPKERSNVDLRLTAAKPAATELPSSPPPAFFDEPQFTVSGVIDTTNLGGHGSDAIVRTRETLAKDTVSLGRVPAGSGPASATTQDDKAKLHHQLGDVQEKLGNSLEAVLEYQRAAELDPSEPNLFDWGSELLLHRAPEPALEVFAQGNRLYPRSARMLLGLGAAWFARGSYDEAVQRICQASDLTPDDPVPYRFLGRIESEQSVPPDELIEKLRRFVRLHPENAEASYYYAVGLWKRRKPQDSAAVAKVESLLNGAIHLDSKFSAAYLQLGILHSEQRDFAQAISDYQQAIQTSPQMEEAHYRLAQAYRQTGETEKAKAEIQLYDQMAKESAQRVERERHEIRQFVYTLRGTSPAQPQ